VVPSEHAAHRADCSVQHVPLGVPLNGPALGGLAVLCHAGLSWLTRLTRLGWGFRVLLLPVGLIGPGAPVAPVIGSGARIARGAGGENKLEKNPPMGEPPFFFLLFASLFFLRGFFNVTLPKT
jgi:hypothetical protein